MDECSREYIAVTSMTNFETFPRSKSIYLYNSRYNKYYPHALSDKSFSLTLWLRKLECKNSAKRILYMWHS